MDIILLRHGQTANNNMKIFNKDDTPLDDTGIMQIERAADRLNNIIIDRAIVSPHLRTRQTFDIINKYHDIPHEIVEDVKEIDVGEIKGMSYDQAAHIYPTEMKNYMEDYLNTRMPGGESVMDVYHRVGRVLEEIKEKGSSVLIVTHQGFISILLSRILGNPDLYQRFDIHNGSYTLVRMEPAPHIGYVNRI